MNDGISPTPGWIDVSEHMPEKRTRVYAAYGTCVWEDAFYGVASNSRYPRHDEEHWRNTHNEEPLVHPVSHWMRHPPLPAPPGAAAPTPASREQAEEREAAALICDSLVALYPRTDVGFDTGYRMGCERAAREIREQPQMQKSDQVHFAANGDEAKSLQPLLDAPLVEAVACAIYDQWRNIDGWVAWEERGNSLKQDEARRIARAALGNRTPARQEALTVAVLADASDRKMLGIMRALNVFGADVTANQPLDLALIGAALSNAGARLESESAAPLPVQGQDTAMLNEYEQREMLGNPHALLFLLDYHDMQQDQADSMEADCYGDILRYEELRQLGAKVIASDPECWDDEICRRFAEPSGHRAKELERALRASSAPTTKR